MPFPVGVLVLVAVLLAVVVGSVTKLIQTNEGTAVVATTTKAPEPSYELVRECKPPFMRKTQERIYKDKDGALWLFDSRGKSKIAEGVKLNEICKKAGGLF